MKILECGTFLWYGRHFSLTPYFRPLDIVLVISKWQKWNRRKKCNIFWGNIFQKSSSHAPFYGGTTGFWDSAPECKIFFLAKLDLRSKTIISCKSIRNSNQPDHLWHFRMGNSSEGAPPPEFTMRQHAQRFGWSRIWPKPLHWGAVAMWWGHGRGDPSVKMCSPMSGQHVCVIFSGKE